MRSPSPLVQVNRRDHVVEVRLNRPSALNAINDEMDRALAEVWAQIDDDSDVRVAILSGAGEKAFCAGGDMRSPPTGAEGLSFGGGLTGIGGRLVRLRKPLICAVHGHVLGLGFELAMCADIIVAADDSQFRLPEARAGVIDHCGVVHRAIRSLPHHTAMAMIVAAEPLDAERAAGFGLVNECVPKDQLPHAVERWAQKVLACSPLVSQAAKQAALEGEGGSLQVALSRQYPLIESFRDTYDQHEGIAAWNERRTPEWQGR